jgi:hypothetical protein
MATFSESATADWDSAQAATGVHHEHPTGTDWAASDTIEKGYPSEWSQWSISAPHAYYPLDEDSGSTATDVMAAADGTITGATVGQPGILGTTCYSFDGVDDRVDATVDVDSWTELTVCAWIHANDTTHPKGIVTWGEDASWGEITLYQTQNSALRWGVGDGGGSKHELELGGGGTRHNEWVFVAGTVQENGSITLYVDEANEGFDGFTTASTTYPTMGNPSSTMQIGNWVRTGDTMDGRVEDVLVFDTELTRSQLRDITVAAL